MKSLYMKSVIVAATLSFLILLLTSLQSNTIPTSIFRGSIGLLPGALFGIILAYIWDLIFMDVRSSNSKSKNNNYGRDHQSEQTTDGKTVQDESNSVEAEKKLPSS